MIIGSFLNHPLGLLNYQSIEEKLKEEGNQVFNPVKMYPEIYLDPIQKKAALAAIFETMLDMDEVYIMAEYMNDNYSRCLIHAALEYGIKVDGEL